MRRWVQLLLCLLLSAGIWFIHNLSQKYVGIVSATIIAETSLDTYSQRSSSEATITAQVSASGYQLAFLNRKRKTVKVVAINSEDFQKVSDNVFTVSNSSLLRYTKELFGEGVSIESFISESPKFVFTNIVYKKVPVHKICSISFAPQYMATSSLGIQPDSVLVYGESAHLENIDFVRTKHLDLVNLNSSVHGKVKLDVPNRRIRLNTDEVIYSMEVNRYVELSEDVRIETRNVPLSQELIVLPSKAKLTLRCAFPSNLVDFEKIKVFVDYNEFVKSSKGVCIPEIEGLSSAVFSYNLEPEIVECIAEIK